MLASAEHPDDIERLQQLAEEIKLCLECGRLKMRPLFGPEQFTQPAIDRGKHEDFEDVGIKTLRETGRYNSGITDVSASFTMILGSIICSQGGMQRGTAAS